MVVVVPVVVVWSNAQRADHTLQKRPCQDTVLTHHRLLRLLRPVEVVCPKGEASPAAFGRVGWLFFPEGLLAPSARNASFLTSCSLS